MAGPAPLDRLERVTDLVLVLLNTGQPLTLDAIALQVPGYPAEHAARRQAFERDKRLLRDEGIPVQTHRLDGLEQYGYRIDRDAFYLPDLALEPDEQVALHLAVAGVHLDDPSGRDALLKLGATGLGEVRPIATLVTPRALIDLFEAVRTQSVASFSYRTAPRRVAPAGLWFRFGHWYLVAWDLDRAAVRTFRVDRIEEAVQLEAPGGAVLPEGIDIKASLPDEPWRAEGDDYVVTRIGVDRIEGPRVAEEVGADRVESRAEDGSVVLSLRVAGFLELRYWILGLLDHAEILDPPAFRSEVIAWLTGIAARAEEPKVTRKVRAVPLLSPESESSARRSPGAGTGDQPTVAATSGCGRVVGPGGGGADRRRGAAVLHGRGRAHLGARAGGVLRRAALHARHADGDRGVGNLGSGLLATRVRPTASAHAGRGIRGGRLGPFDHGRARARRRCVAPCLVQTRCGLRIARGDRHGCRCSLVPRRRASGDRRRANWWRSTITQPPVTSGRRVSSTRCR